MAAIEGADPEFAVFVRVAAAGSRRGEVGALRWPAVNLDAGELVISKGLIESKIREILSLGAPAPSSRDVPQAPNAGEDGSGIEAPDTLLAQ